MTKCAVVTCDRVVYAKGWCNPHWIRSRKGDVRADEPLELKNRPAWEKILERIVIVGDCWQWQGFVSYTGYGTIKSRGKQEYVHRAMYEHEIGPIPEGLSLDHLCHTADKSCAGGWTCPHRRCVNPAHLEPVTNRENSLRGRAGDSVRRRVALLTHCPQGHEYTPENTRFYAACGRVCMECNRQRGRANRKKKQT